MIMNTPLTQLYCRCSNTSITSHCSRTSSHHHVTKPHCSQVSCLLYRFTDTTTTTATTTAAKTTPIQTQLNSRKERTRRKVLCPYSVCYACVPPQIDGKKRELSETVKKSRGVGFKARALRGEVLDLPKLQGVQQCVWALGVAVSVAVAVAVAVAVGFAASCECTRGDASDDCLCYCVIGMV
jgi:hypothetical protein